MVEKRNKVVLRFIVLIALLHVTVIAGVIYFLSPRGAETIEWLKNLPRPVWIYAGSGFFISFFLLALMLGLRDTREPSSELSKLAQDLGVSICRKWGFQGTFGRVSLFGYGPYFEMSYRGNLISYATVMDENSSWGVRLVVHHKQPLSLGLFFSYRASPFTTPGRMASEYKDIFAKKLDIRENGLDIWAVDTQSAELLFQKEETLKNLQKFRKAFEDLLAGDYGKYHRSGFVINDKSITVLVPDPSLIKMQLVEAMHDLSDSFVSSGVLPAVPKVSLAHRLCKAIFIGLFALTVVWAILDFGGHIFRKLLRG